MRAGYSIKTHNLTKRFGDFIAVDAIDLHLNPGESYGFLGPNGAGKTTTLLMILGILRPDVGNVLINGQTVRRNSFDIKRKIGVVAEYQTFYEEMTAWEYLMLFGNLFDVEKAESRAEKLLRNVGLSRWRDVLISGYSTGMKKKLGFVRALLPSPELLILDEPVSGLDPFGIIQIRELLIAEQKAGCTLLISSHILSEVEQTVDRVGIIANGKLIAEDTMNNLRKSVGGTQIIKMRFLNLTENVVSLFSDQPFVKDLKHDGNKLTIKTSNDKDYREFIGKLILEQHLIVLEMKQEEVSLEEAFITITENNLGQITETLVEAT